MCVCTSVYLLVVCTNLLRVFTSRVYLCVVVYLPVVIVVCRCDQQTAGGLVPVAEGRGEADGGLLQSAPPQLLPTAGTLLRHREAEDLLLTVTQSDHVEVHRLNSFFYSFSPPLTHQVLLQLLNSFFNCYSVFYLSILSFTPQALLFFSSLSSTIQLFIVLMKTVFNFSNLPFTPPVLLLIHRSSAPPFFTVL